MLRTVACSLCLLWGCDLESGSRGDECTRSTQCRVGLACVEGVCSDDLGAIAEQSEVPVLVMEEPEAGVDAEAPTPDAGDIDGAAGSAADAAGTDAAADASAMPTDGGDGG